MHSTVYDDLFITGLILGFSPALQSTAEFKICVTQLYREIYSKKLGVGGNLMKIGRNSPCPCGSGKKYKKCCLGKDQFTPSAPPSHRSIEEIPSDFEHIVSTAHDLKKVVSQYDFYDLTIAIFCINAWRRNRSALSQGLTLNMALTLCSHDGSVPIKTFSELTSFFAQIASRLEITSLEDYTIDDFGEIFLNHMGHTYRIITGTGHQQVYATMRYMQQLAQRCSRGDELTVMLDYIDSIILLTLSNCLIALEMRRIGGWKMSIFPHYYFRLLNTHQTNMRHSSSSSTLIVP